MLPSPPRILRIHPNRLSAEQAGAVRTPGCRLRDADITFDDLFATLGACPGWRAIDAWGSRFVVRGLLGASSGRLSAAAPDAYAVRATHQALMELRMAGVTSRQLAVGQASAELKDLTALLGAYEDALETAQLHDAADTQRQAVFDVVHGEVPYQWQALERIEVAAGTELFGSRLDLLNAFCSRGVRVEVTLPWDEERSAAFAWPEAMLHALESRGHERLRVRYTPRTGDGVLSPLRAAQFANRKVEAAPVEVLQVAEGDEHQQQVLAKVVTWLRAGTPAHAIAVVTPDSSAALPLARHLNRAGVPAFNRRGAALSESRAAQIVLGALEARENGMPRDAVAELWEACGTPIATPDGLWSQRRVAGELRRLRLRTCEPGALRAAWEADPGRASPAQIEAVSSTLDTFVARLAALPLATDLEAGLVALVQLLVDAVPTVAVQAPTSQPAAATSASSIDAASKAHAAATAAFLQVRQALLQLVQASRLSPTPLQFTGVELMDWLRLLFDEQRQAPPGVRSGAVRVFSPDELVGTRFEKVLVVGANVGVFPRLAPADPVLTDVLRHAINQRLGPRLVQYGPLQGRGALPGDARDTWLWLEILHSCQSELTVTCASDDDSGPSELVDELLRSTRQSVASPPVSYLLPHPPSVSLWLQAWTLGDPRRGITGGGPLKWRSLDAALRKRLGARHCRVAASMASMWQRSLPTQTATTGQLPKLTADARGWLEAALLGRTQSTSRMDALGMCRYKHFASAVLRLRKDDVATLSANPREQGSVAHAGLYLVYADIVKRGGFKEARLRPDETMARAKEVYWSHPEALLKETVVHPLLRKATLLHAWQAVQTQLERDLKASGGEPLALEYRFDDRPASPEDERPGAQGDVLVLKHPTLPRTLRVRGSIDRVDARDDTLETLDYKRTLSSRTPGRHFQLAIYAAVAHRDLQPDAASLSAGWLGLWDGRRKLASELTGDGATLNDYFNDSLWPRIDAVLGGELTPDPDGDDLCARCDFAALCRAPYEGLTLPEAE